MKKFIINITVGQTLTLDDFFSLRYLYYKQDIILFSGVRLYSHLLHFSYIICDA